MQSLAEIADPVPPVRCDTSGSTVYDRFANEPDTLAIAVVDEEDRPVGLVERNAFSLKMASEYGRALFARRPVTLVMQADPLVVEGAASIVDFTGETLSTRSSDIIKGFIIVEQGRYVGVANSLALLQATSTANRLQAHAMTELASSFRLLFDNNPVAMWVVDRISGKIIGANPAALAQYRYTLEEITNLSMLDLLAPDEHERFRARVPLLKDRVYDGEDEWRQVRSDGSELIAEPHIRPMTYAGRPAYLCALFDVTKRRETEDQICQTRAFLDTVVESIPQTLFVRDAVDHRLILINRAGEELFGVTRKDVLGTIDEDLFPAEKAVDFKLRRQKALETGTLQSDEEIVTTRLGERILETKRIAVQSAPGHRPFLLALCQDVTERKRDAETLRQARDAAEASNRAKSEFLANMSHEIRTPLNGVVGVADALARTPLNPVQQEMIAIMQSSAAALDRLLSDVLDLARVESGRLSITPEPFDMVDMVRQAASLFQSSAHAKGLGFEVGIDAAARGWVAGDVVRIKQILFNLLSNAIKFTSQGRVVLDVRVERGETDTFAFCVSDTGVGFEPANKDALFGRFQQADGSITRRYGGSGLGLAISRDLAELMGGALDAASTPGAGATFTLTLPLERVEAAAVEPSPSPGPVPASAASPPGDAAAVEGAMKVLLADDHPTNRKVVELILGTADVALTSVENGAEAVEAFKATPFDIVLMDLQMPVMDGLSAIAAIREWERNQGRGVRTPILALTANALPEHVRASLAAGADGHLAKPITAAALFAALADALDAAAEPDAPTVHAA